ncbi:hypothetical protein Hanom_Chr05g00443861 [Helianthus anomalus]
MMDDIEEGEIRDDSSPDDDRKVQNDDEPPSGQQPPEGEKPIGHDSLHGNEEISTHSPRLVSRDENVHENEPESVGFPRNRDGMGDNGAAGNGAQLHSVLDRSVGINGPDNTPGLMNKTHLG